MRRGTAFFALRSCRARVCSWTQLPPYLCRWFWKIGVCRRTSGWHALSLKHFTPTTGQIMGFTLETGIFCLVPDRKIPVGHCFDWLLRSCFLFCTSPPGCEMGDDESEEAVDRRRGLLRKVCSQERAVSYFAKPWSDSTSVRKPLLLNWMSLSFLPSTSACYWDPEVALRLFGSYFPICNVLGGEYTPTYFGQGESNRRVSIHTLLHDLPSPQKKKYIIIYNRPMRLPVWRFGWGRSTAQERYGTVLHRAITCGDDCWIEYGIQVCPTLYVQWIFSIARGVY